MKSFTLTLNNTTYECSSNHSSGNDQNWFIRAEMSGMKIIIDIPIENKLTRIQCIAFIERLHEGMLQARQDQKPQIEYTGN